MKAAVGFGKGVIFDFTSSPPHLTDGQPCAAQLRMELGNLLIVVEASIKCYDVGLNKNGLISLIYFPQLQWSTVGMFVLWCMRSSSCQFYSGFVKDISVAGSNAGRQSYFLKSGFMREKRLRRLSLQKICLAPPRKICQSLQGGAGQSWYNPILPTDSSG